MDYAVIAAGLGSRLQSEGAGRPKPLTLLNGVAMIDRLLRIFLENNASSVHVIINEEMSEVRDYLSRMSLGVPLHLTVKSTPSSMHSFFELSHRLSSEKFCLTTVDTIFRQDEFRRYVQDFASDEADGLMGVSDFIDDEKPLYVNVGDKLTVESFTDEPTAQSRYVSGGIYGLKRQTALPVLQQAMHEQQFRMRNFQRRLIAAGLLIKAWPFTKIIDVDHASDIRKAERFLAAEQSFH
ncbi:MAG: NTP transferase domain-containing protein [Tannerellaceae bacterium]|jgi:NDP-sugar pyrophosphorylase family protein|nr:NTP transferase domain-containing protein [Tannerellaceae bacterium]